MNAEEDPRLWRRNLGILLTLAGIVAAEIALQSGESFAASLVFIATLGAVAYSGLSADVRGALISTGLLVVYSLHFVSGPKTLVRLAPDVLVSALIVVGLGLAMSLPMVIVKRREDRLRRDLRAHAAELEARNRALVESNSSLEAFGYVVSHDLKEPVRAIRAYLEAVRESEGEEARTDLERAYAANERLARMLEGLLAYSRASSTATVVKPLGLRDVIESEACRAQYEGLLREKGGALDLDPGLPAVLGDEVILAQLFGNLLLNALRHGGAKPHVTVRAMEGTAPGTVRVAVEDEGPGFPPEVLTRVQHLRARPATVKSGFGLVIAHRAAQRLNGRLWLENSTEGGARVNVELPMP